MDAATFRADFPEFASATDYPDAQVNHWLAIAVSFVNIDRWGGVYNFGLELFAAHNLTQWKTRMRAAAMGNAPGQTQGVVSAKALDKGSYSFDTGATTIEGAGNWNATTYGVQFYDYMMMFGAGGYQL